MKSSKILILAFVSLLSVQCKKKESTLEVCFDKATLLTETGNNIIIPRFVSLNQAIDALKLSWDVFKINPIQPELDQVRSDWSDANRAFQKAKVFSFGPAVQFGLNAALGTFPTDTTKIVSNISDPNANLYTTANIDAIGFPALEYLIFDATALTSLISSDRQEYVEKLIDKMKSEAQSVLDAWNSSYLSTFVTSTGTESTSGFSLFVNAFNFDYELAKNAKLGIPIGTQSLGIPQLVYEEAPFANASLRILKENVTGLYNLYLGKSGSNNGTGFDDYLKALDRESTQTTISNRFDEILSLMDELSEDLAIEVQNQPDKLQDLYTKMQNLVVYLKTDMTSAFGVLITYQDNDGD